MGKNYDVVIVGGGPAGISAGIYALRTGVKTLVIDADNSSLSNAKEIQNYYGIESISGKELKEKGINQFKNLGGYVLFDQVLKITKDYQTNIFTVKTKSESFESKVILLAMGSPKKKTVEGLEKFEGTNVSYCAICDGFFYKNKTVAVLGSGEFALSECEELEKMVKKIYLIAKNTQIDIKKHKNIEIVNKNIAEFRGQDFVKEILFDDGSKIDIDGVFIAEGSLTSFELSKQLGLLDKNNFIMVDKNFMSNVAGVFCAGDMIGGLLQISKAVSDGAQAGLEAVRYLKVMELKDE